MSVCRKSSILAAVAVFSSLVGCGRGRPKVECSPVPLVDSVGAASEKERIEFQWLAIRVGLDSALRTADGIRRHRSAEGGLDSSIARYRDSLKTEGSGLVAKSGCLDWKTTWETGTVDKAALATVWLRMLGKDSASVVEWNQAPDSVGGTALSVHAVFAKPGKDGGAIDSAVLRVEPAMVSLSAK